MKLTGAKSLWLAPISRLRKSLGCIAAIGPLQLTSIFLRTFLAGSRATFAPFSIIGPPTVLDHLRQLAPGFGHAAAMALSFAV